ncbi:MAG TPA: COX15/CtaA family protein [Acetobacteraceae bacterium]|nr:COX15/CtaA family protein [Acetobacteraceae bacterium]
MPFDVREFPANGALRRAETTASRRLVALWLFGLCAMIWVMVVLGGVTRLTGSGLSIMEWAPLSGTLPPLSESAWQNLFALYKSIPQYQILHPGMGLAGFKGLFWLEWTHRLWGRLLGVAMLVPLIWFAATHRIDRRLVPRLVFLFILGGLQGAVGWFMVASGFDPDSTSVAPARLVLHLVFALSLYVAILWTGLSHLYPTAASAGPGERALRPLAIIAAGTLALAIVAGGFVAGTHAGFEYNTFPLMEGRLVPADYDRLQPFLANLVGNLAAVQFDHRVLATLAALAGLGAAGVALIADVSRRVRAAALALGFFLLVQYALGVATLLLVVPIPLAAAHQANAVLALTAAAVLLHRLRPVHRARA